MSDDGSGSVMDGHGEIAASAKLDEVRVGGEPCLDIITMEHRSVGHDCFAGCTRDVVLDVRPVVVA